jgi:hypothetical protein
MVFLWDGSDEWGSPRGQTQEEWLDKEEDLGFSIGHVD